MSAIGWKFHSSHFNELNVISGLYLNHLSENIVSVEVLFLAAANIAVSSRWTSDTSGL